MASVPVICVECKGETLYPVYTSPVTGRIEKLSRCNDCYQKELARNSREKYAGYFGEAIPYANAYVKVPTHDRRRAGRSIDR